MILMRNLLRLAAAGGAIGLVACGGSSNSQPPEPPQVGPGIVVYGVRGETELVKFNADAPDVLESVGPITNIGNGERVIGLDFRPADGALHAITSQGRSLILDPENAMATVIQPISGDGTALTGNRFGVDFNPAANALRIIGDDGQNLRVPTAALTAPAPAEPVNTVVDGRMGYLQGVTAAAYTNPDPDAAGTQLFVIDTDNDALYTQDANNGPLTLVGSLGMDATAASGYDIVLAGETNEHYALLTVGSTTGVYSLNPATGAASLIDELPAASYKGLVVEKDLDDLTAPRRFVAPLVQDGQSASYESYLLDTETGTLTFDETFPIAGLPAGEELVGTDVRTTSIDPSSDEEEFYAVGRSGAIYVIGGDPQNPGQDLAVEVAALSTPLSGTRFGVDFNPRADLLRIVSDTGQNLRVNLQADRAIACRDGVSAPRAAGFACVDGTTRLVSPAPQIVATAYRAAPANGTFQFALDARDSSLYRVAVPNDGALVNVGPLGVTLPTGGDELESQSLDISGENDTTVLAALRLAGAARSTLYSVNLETGAATAIGEIGDGGAVNAITARVEE